MYNTLKEKYIFQYYCTFDWKKENNMPSADCPTKTSQNECSADATCARCYSKWGGNMC